MQNLVKHKDFCSAGQPAPCEGYFTGNVLPCVCGAEGNVIQALNELAPEAPVGGTPPTAEEPATVAAANPMVEFAR